MPPFSEDLILEAFDKINSQSSYYLLILGLLQKLANHLDKGIASPELKKKAREKEQVVAEKLNTLFRDFDLDLIMKKSYQDTLQNIVAMESAPTFDSGDMEDLKKTLDSHSVDVQVSSIILEILKSGLTIENMESLERNLRDLCAYFVQIGDFKALVNLYNQLEGISASRSNQDSRRSGTIKFFSTPDFIEELLNGVEIWGKDKFTDIKKLICQVGTPFIPPMLDRLAEESSLTIRRFLLEILSEIGARARDPMLNRLQDKRWYFVRNLILVLRNQGDASVLPSIRDLRNHEHPRVREEVLKTLLHFHDPDGDRFLLADLRSLDAETRRNAIPLAEMSKDPLVFQCLLELLHRSPCNGPGVELKQLIVRSLSKIGNARAFPHLEKTLQLKSFFNGQALNRLKGEVIKSIEFYSPKESLDFLQNLLQKKEKQFVPLVSQTMERVRQRSLS
jgi:HEAT repeat protein